MIAPSLRVALKKKRNKNVYRTDKDFATSAVNSDVLWHPLESNRDKRTVGLGQREENRNSSIIAYLRERARCGESQTTRSIEDRTPLLIISSDM
jgi:hypothetical protein